MSTRTIVNEVTSSESVKKGVAWMVDRLQPVIASGIDSAEQRAAFENKIAMALGLRFAGIFVITGEEGHFEGEQLVRLDAGPVMDLAIADAARQCKVRLSSGAPEITVVMQPHRALGSFNGESTVIWERVNSGVE